jgi:hypothetical protein
LFDEFDDLNLDDDEDDEDGRNGSFGSMIKYSAEPCFFLVLPFILNKSSSSASNSLLNDVLPPFLVNISLFAILLETNFTYKFHINLAKNYQSYFDIVFKLFNFNFDSFINVSYLFKMSFTFSVSVSLPFLILPLLSPLNDDDDFDFPFNKSISI